MDNEKTAMDFNEGGERDQETPEMAPRARNRTVMLTPEMTGQVRARLAQDDSGSTLAPPPASLLATGTGFMGRTQSPPPKTGTAAYSPSETGGFEPYQSFAQQAQTPALELPPPPSLGAQQYQEMPEPVRTAPVPPPQPQYTPPVMQQQQPPQMMHQMPQAPQVAQHVPVPPPVPVTSSVTKEAAHYTKPSPVVGFLVSFDGNENGTVFELRTGRLIVTSDPSVSGSLMYLDDETVSPMHAVLRISPSGDLQILDQLSEHGTKIRRFGSEEVEELSGEKSSLDHGDMVMFGNRTFYVCLLAMPDRG